MDWRVATIEIDRGTPWKMIQFVVEEARRRLGGPRFSYEDYETPTHTVITVKKV